MLLIAGKDDLDDLMGFVAAEATHASNPRRRAALDEVLGVLEAASAGR